MKWPVSFAITLSAAIALSGCAASKADYPTLSIRDFERQQGSFEAPEGSAALTPAPLPLEKMARVAALRQNIASAHQTFMGEVPSSRNAVRGAAGTSVGNDRWSAAQVALSSLESRRSLAAVVLSDLDLMFVDTTLAFEERDAVANAREYATLLIREEDEILAELRGALSQ